MPTVHYFTRKPFKEQFSIEELFAVIRSHLPEEFDSVEHQAPWYSKGLFPRLRIGLNARQNQGEINHITGDIHFIAPFLDRSKTVLTVHDCVPLTQSGGLRHSLLKLFWFWLPVRQVARITTISEKSRKELARYTGIPENRIKVIPNCVAPAFVPGESRPIGNGPLRILQIGIRPNKNLSRVCDALEGLSCDLTIIGQLSPDQEQHLKNRNIRYTALYGLSREDLAESYRQADIVTFVSTYEGFGMPVIEAQASGTALLTSNISPMLEVAGPGACLVDPHDVDSIRRGLLRLLEDASYREAVIRSGLQNVKQYRPTAVAEKYAAIYRSM